MDNINFISEDCLEYLKENDNLIINLKKLGIELNIEESTTETLVLKKMKRYTVWRDIKMIHGYVISGKGIGKVDSKTEKLFENEGCTIAREFKHAKAMIAMAKISQLMPYYGGEVEGKEDSYFGYTYFEGDFTVEEFTGMYLDYPRFKTREAAENFISEEDNFELLKDLYMIE